MASEALCHLIAAPTSFLVSLILYCLSLVHSAIATKVFLLFLEYIKHVLASGPLYWLFSVSRMPSFNILTCPLLYFLQIFAQISTCEWELITPFKLQYPPSITNTPYPAPLFSPEHYIPAVKTWMLTRIWSSSPVKHTEECISLACTHINGVIQLISANGFSTELTCAIFVPRNLTPSTNLSSDLFHSCGSQMKKWSWLHF